MVRSRTDIPRDLTLTRAVDHVASELASAGVYFGHGALDAEEEAAWLVLAACGIPLDSDPVPWERTLNARDTDAVRRLLRERIDTRMPLAYLLREAWFAGHSFYVDERVLVPRSHFTEWIPQRFEPWIRPDRVKHVLDLCCGSGCIGIATALAFPRSRVVLSDISAEALEVARINVARHCLEDRVSIRQGDALQGLDQRFDLILCNPPYVSTERMDRLPLEYRTEPALGLAAGPDGLDFIRGLLSKAVNHLNPGGTLLVEAGSAGEAVLAEWPEIPFTWLSTESDEPVLFMIDRETLEDPGGRASQPADNTSRS